MAIKTRWFRLVAATLILAVLAGLGHWQKSSPGSWLRLQLAQRQQQAGLAALQQRDVAAALEHFDRALHWNPWQREARWQRIQLSIRRGQADLAFLHLTAYVELFPDAARGWLELARAMRAGGVSVDAEEAAGRAVEADPAALEARLLRAELRLDNGRLSGVGSDLAVVLARQPEEPRALALRRQLQAALAAGREEAAKTRPPDRRRGQFWPSALGRHVSGVLAAMGRQDWDAARAAAQRAAGAYPGTMFGPWLQAVVALNQGQYETAETLLLQALEIAPRSQRAVTLLIQVWARWQGATRAGEKLLAMADEDPGHELLWTIAAQAFIEARQPSRALAEMRARLDLPGAGAIPYRRLVDIQRQLDDPAAALARCREGLARYPQDKELAGLLPSLLAALDRPDEARRAYERYLADWPDDHVATAGLIHLLLDHEPRAMAAVRDLTDRLSRDYPADAAVLDAMARARLALGEVQSARVLADAAVRAEPDNPSYIFRLGSIRARLGDADGALRAIDQALDASGPFAHRIEALRLRRELGGAGD